MANSCRRIFPHANMPGIPKNSTKFRTPDLFGAAASAKLIEGKGTIIKLAFARAGTPSLPSSNP
ncbi:hypothetical protein [Mesorhizobium sp. LjNodule214]|uniref:hypothetical protein n=1 Tax=Mesorhizobium sp. LjNodule214 TaxID=3342252 RepID=UPI003ED0E0C4